MSADQTNYEAIMKALNAIADWMGRIDAKLDSLSAEDDRRGLSTAMCDYYNASRLTHAVKRPKPKLTAIDGGKSMHALADEQDDMA